MAFVDVFLEHLSRILLQDQEVSPFALVVREGASQLEQHRSRLFTLKTRSSAGSATELCWAVVCPMSPVTYL